MELLKNLSIFYSEKKKGKILKMKQEEKIGYLSEFIEKPKTQIFGFTLTYKNGEIENHFIRGSWHDISHKIIELKELYEKLIKLQNKK